MSEKINNSGNTPEGEVFSPPSSQGGKIPSLEWLYNYKEKKQQILTERKLKTEFLSWYDLRTGLIHMYYLEYYLPIEVRKVSVGPWTRFGEPYRDPQTNKIIFPTWSYYSSRNANSQEWAIVDFTPDLSYVLIIGQYYHRKWGSQRRIYLLVEDPHEITGYRVYKIRFRKGHAKKRWTITTIKEALEEDLIPVDLELRDVE